MRHCSGGGRVRILALRNLAVNTYLSMSVVVSYLDGQQRVEGARRIGTDGVELNCNTQTKRSNQTRTLLVPDS